MLVICGPAGCSTPPPGDPAQAARPLVTPSERAELQTSLMAALRANRDRQCPRPVLQAPALPGRPDPLIVALVEPEGDLARCADGLSRSPPPWGMAPRAPGTAVGALPALGPLPGATAAPAWPGSALAEACAPLPKAIARAGRFGAVCSPYLPGRRRLPQLVPLVHLLQGAAWLSRTQAPRDPAGAAWSLLAVLRLQQDLCRGGTPFIWPFVLRGPLRLTVAVLAEILASGRLDSRTLTALDVALETLAATEPPPRSYLRGEQLTVELASFLRPLMPRRWVPPGGTPLPGFDPAAGVVRRSFGSPVQDLLLAWLAHRIRHRRWEARCPPQAPPARCLGALSDYAREVELRTRTLAERWASLEQTLGHAFASDGTQGKRGVDGDHTARAAALEWLVALGPTTTADHLRRGLERSFWIAALRVHVAVLLAQAGGREPLTPGAVLALPALRRDPVWGEPFALQGSPGSVALRPPRRLAAQGDPPLVYFMRWPAEDRR